MQSRKLSCNNNHLSYIMCVLRRRFLRLCLKIRRLVWQGQRRHKLVIRRLNSEYYLRKNLEINSEIHHINNRPIRLATFNGALFSLTPAVPKAERSVVLVHEKRDCLKIGTSIRPKGILKQSSPLHPTKNESKPKVYINLPENEISLARNRVLTVVQDSCNKTLSLSPNPMRSPLCFISSMVDWVNSAMLNGNRTISDVLKEVDADILALQDVKAEEENDMKPLSDLARSLGMNYVFAERAGLPSMGSGVWQCSSVQMAYQEVEGSENM